MTTLRRISFVSLIAVLVAACDDDPSDPNPEPAVDCSAEVTEVEAHIDVDDDAVVFDWSPRCRVALLGVEEGASDRWWIGDEEQNTIEPPVTYGVTPDGVPGEDPLPLEPGVVYELILWIATDDGPYLATVAEFER